MTAMTLPLLTAVPVVLSLEVGGSWGDLLCLQRPFITSFLTFSLLSFSFLLPSSPLSPSFPLSFLILVCTVSRSVDRHLLLHEVSVQVGSFE